MQKPFALALLAALAVASGPAAAEKIRDLADVSGARENQLLGYGVVVGLNGTGDDTSAPVAAQSMQSLLTKLGVKVDPKQLKLRNVAAVLVTATLPPFIKAGSKIDVTVASMGNAKSLTGGMLVQTTLKAADGKTYAVAQGNLLLGGFDAKGGTGSSVKSGTTTVARIPEGAIVEKEVAAEIVTGGKLKLELRTPGFGTANKMMEAIDAKFGAGTASAPDPGAIVVKLPSTFEGKSIAFVAALEDLEVKSVHKARVVINEKTGTIVASGDVRLSPIAVVHGALTIVIKEEPVASQPTPGLLGGTGGTTVVVPKTDVQAKDDPKSMKYLPAAPTLSDFASALGALALSPREMASVLQAIRTAGALEAEVVVQ